MRAVMKDRERELLQASVTTDENASLNVDACTCLNCGAVFTGEYCPECGQKAATGRITVSKALQSLLAAVTSLDGRFFRTMGNLFWRPGHLVRDYITGKRSGYMHPVSLLSTLVAVYLLVIFFFGVEPGSINIMNDEYMAENVHSDTLAAIFVRLSVMLNNKVVSSLLSAFVCLLPFALMFRGKKISTPANSISAGEGSMKLNIAEHFCALVYAACLDFTLSVILKLAETIGMSHPIATSLDNLLFLLVPVVVYRQLYGVSWWSALWRGLLAIILTLTALALLVILIFGITYGIDAVN